MSSDTKSEVDTQDNGGWRHQNMSGMQEQIPPNTLLQASGLGSGDSLKGDDNNEKEW
jgi:hypothetical protein